jgi:hypothetical protein
MVMALTILRLPDVKTRTGQRAHPGSLELRGQLWGQQVFAESPGSSVYAGFQVECEGRRLHQSPCRR